MLLLSKDDIKNCLAMKEVISACRKAFSDLSASAIKVPQRVAIRNPGLHSQCLFMPGFSEKLSAYGLKVVSINERNPEKNLPFIHSNILLTNANTGEIISVMDGEWITGMRTGAAAGVASDLLARSDAEVFALFGTGFQARFQIEAVLNVRDIKKIILYGRNEEKSVEFARQVTETFQVKTVAASSPAQVSEADIITTATTSMTPVIEKRNLKEGVHINGVGSYTSQMQEISTDIVEHAKIYVDKMEAALIEAGDLIIPINQQAISPSTIIGEIGELINGVVVGRENSEEITFFKSVGNAAQDLYTAKLAYSKASKANLGTRFNF